MTRWQQTRTVAHWEFNRFVKWRQQFVWLAISLALGTGGTLVWKASARAKAGPVTVAVVGAEALGFALPDAPPVVWDTATRWGESEARSAVAEERLGGALLVRSPGDAELVIRRRAGWTEPMERELSAARRAAAFAQLTLAPEVMAALQAPFAVRTTLTSAGAAPVARSTRIGAGLVLVVGLVFLFSGFGTLFAGITGEKQQRVTEQMVAMLTPQTWVDGKILGLAAAAAVGTAFMLAGGALFFGIVLPLLGSGPVALPPIASDFGLLALIVVVTLLGVAMWFAFMAAMAATIDDPHSSTRSLLLIAPMVPMGLAFGLLGKADTVIAQVLSVFPLTSMAVLPLRLMLTTVPWWEVVLALALLAAAAWFFRRAAGKIFGTAVLMYGKEPTLREVWRWAREA